VSASDSPGVQDGEQTAVEMKPWPPSARHHHGFMRTGILWIGDDRSIPVAYVDDTILDGAHRYPLVPRQQRIDEWMEWVDSIGGLDGIKAMAHPCTPIGCFFTFMAEVLTQADIEGVDSSAVWTDAATAARSEVVDRGAGPLNAAPAGLDTRPPGPPSAASEPNYQGTGGEQ
jgi:hypothetical protein